MFISQYELSDQDGAILYPRVMIYLAIKEVN
jgi:hypothetical protein